MMKIALAFGQGDKEAAVSVLRVFQEIQIDASAFQIGVQWETAGRDLVEQLDRATHVIIIASVKSVRFPWFPFLVGYVTGKHPRGFLYVIDSAIVPDPYSSILDEFRDIESLKSFYIEQKQIWENQERIADAKNDLVESGIGLTNENFTLCVIQGNLSAVNDFLTLGFSPDTENVKGVPILILAVRNHHRDIARILLGHGADLNRKSGDRGNTALMDAAVLGDVEMVRELLDAGADMNVKSKNGQTALMLAVGEGRDSIAEELIDRGADLSITDNLGMSAKKYAELFKQTSILSILEKT